MTGNPKADTERRVKRAAEILRISELMDRRPKQLSGGQRQRVAIGRAIVREPQVFLFDEPLSNLDAELRVQMRVEISRLHKELGTTMIYVTHDQTEAMTLADRIVVLRAGHIEQIGRPLDLYDDPDNQFVAGFVGSPKMNFINGRSRRAQHAQRHGRARRPGADPHHAAADRLPRPKSGSKVIVGVRPEHFGEAGRRRRRPRRRHRRGRASRRHQLTLRPNGQWRRRGDPARRARRCPRTAEVTVSIRKSYLFDENGLRLR